MFVLRVAVPKNVVYVLKSRFNDCMSLTAARQEDFPPDVVDFSLFLRKFVLKYSNGDLVS